MLVSFVVNRLLRTGQQFECSSLTPNLFVNFTLYLFELSINNIVEFQVTTLLKDCLSCLHVSLQV